ncbi:MAG: metallophosphoesterase [Planctomycetia bacterium]|nr:metallophosphoesterase [Planctomycetia bacterium]
MKKDLLLFLFFLLFSFFPRVNGIAANVPLPADPPAAAKSSEKISPKTDKNLVVFASDMHLIKKVELRVGKKGEKGIHQRYYTKMQPGEWLIEYDTKENLRLFIQKMLAMNPRPAAVLFLGDIASDTDQEIYSIYRSLLKPLADAGIPYWNIPGNHDHFDNYYSIFPEERKKSIVPVEKWGAYRVELPAVDFVLMETFAPKKGDRNGSFDRFFKQKERDFYKKYPNYYVYEGWFTPEQHQWLKEQLQKNPAKPIFLCGHHPMQMEFVFPEHDQFPNFQGWICGHYHTFYQIVREGSNRSIVLPGLGVPGIGWNLDPPGYVIMKMEPNQYRFQYCTLNPSEPQNGRTFIFPILNRSGERK